MSVRGKIRRRLNDLRIIGESAKKKENQEIMLDSLIRSDELKILLKELRK